MQSITTKIIGVSVLAVALAGLANCKSDDDNNNDVLALLALASLQRSGGSLLSPQQFQGAATASAVSAASSAAAAGSTAMGTPDPARLMAGIIENGRDPVYARQAVQRYQAELRTARRSAARVQPAAITSTRTAGGACTGSGGTYACNGTYTLSGSQAGVNVQEVTVNVAQYNPYLSGQTCLVTGKTQSGTRGLMTVNSGSEMTWSVSGGTGSYTSTMNLNFNDFGSLWFDYYTYMRIIKDALSSGNTSAFSPFGTTCADVQGYYALFNRIYNSSVLNGDVQSTSTNTFSSTGAGGFGTVSSASSYTTNIKSSNLTVDSAAVTPLDLTLTQSSSFSGSSGSFSGSFSMTFSGTVAGVVLNDTLTVTF
jgi:hypothetical protein